MTGSEFFGKFATLSDKSMSLMHIKCPRCKPGMTEAGSDVVI